MTNSPQQWLDWKQSRNRTFSDPTGFLAITELVWLTKEQQEEIKMKYPKFLSEADATDFDKKK
jgi:uncharacterized protein (DUF1684 family)